jgi:hypothetical protein
MAGITSGIITAFGAIGTLGGAGAAGGTAGVLGTAYTAGNVAAGVLTVGSVASAGYSAYSGYQQASAAEAASAYNAAVQKNNARLQASNASRQRYQIQTQAAQDIAIAENQIAWQNYQTQVNQNNAIALANQAKATDEEGRENIRREREKKRRALGNIRATSASRGLNVGEGTVVESLADTSHIMELDILDISRNAQQEVNNLYYQSELAEASAARSQAEAGITGLRRKNAIENFSSGRYIEMQGRTQAAQTRAQAQFTLLSGQNAASNARLSGYATGINTLGSQYTQSKQRKDAGVGTASNSFFGSGNLGTAK